MLIKNYNFSEEEISIIISDNNNGEHLWIGFESNGTTCNLQKVSAHDPLQKYFDLDLSVEEIKAGIINSTYLYLALDDDEYIARRYTLSNPLSGSVDFVIPSGIVEAPVDVLVSTYVYLLIPGNISGQNAKIVKMTTAGAFVETIDLSTVTNAKSFTVDTVTGDIWVCTYTSPATFVRVYNDGSWHYTVNY